MKKEEDFNVMLTVSFLTLIAGLLVNSLVLLEDDVIVGKLSVAYMINMLLSLALTAAVMWGFKKYELIKKKTKTLEILRYKQRHYNSHL